MAEQMKRPHVANPIETSRIETGLVATVPAGIVASDHQTGGSMANQAGRIAHRDETGEFFGRAIEWRLATPYVRLKRSTHHWRFSFGTP